MGVAQLAYEPQPQTITGLPVRQEHVTLLKHVKHSEDALHIFTDTHDKNGPTGMAESFAFTVCC
jgi:hypothetical protein